MNCKMFSLLLVLMMLLVLGMPVMANQASTTDFVINNDSDKLVKDFFVKLSKEQVEIRNNIIKENPNISEWELLLQLIPEITEHFSDEVIEKAYSYKAEPFISNEPFIYLYSEYGPLSPVFKGKREIQINQDGTPSFGEFSVTRTDWPPILSSGTMFPSGGMNLHTTIPNPWYMPLVKVAELTTAGSIGYGQYWVSLNGCNANSWANYDYFFASPNPNPNIWTFGGYDTIGWNASQTFNKYEYWGGPISHSIWMQITITGYPGGSWHLAYAISGNPWGTTVIHTPSAGWYN